MIARARRRAIDQNASAERTSEAMPTFKAVSGVQRNDEWSAQLQTLILSQLQGITPVTRPGGLNCGNLERSGTSRRAGGIQESNGHGQ